MALRPPSVEDVSAGALAGQPFAAYLVVLGLLGHPSEAQWSEADPILLIFPRAISVWSVPVLSVAFALVLWRTAPPTRQTLRRALLHGALGCGAAVLAVGALRLAVGPTMPAFIPSEESARPGFQLSMTAGYAEEVLFRFAALPLFFFWARRRMSEPVAAAMAALTIGLAFAILHEGGPGPFELRYFVTRTLIPGAAMSLAYLYVSPAFVIVAHSSAHLLIPALFV